MTMKGYFKFPQSPRTRDYSSCGLVAYGKLVGRATHRYCRCILKPQPTALYIYIYIYIYMSVCVCMCVVVVDVVTVVRKWTQWNDVKYSLAGRKLKSHDTVTKWYTGKRWPVNCITVISARRSLNMPLQRGRKLHIPLASYGRRLRGQVWW